jgi:hypothetical protein
MADIQLVAFAARLPAMVSEKFSATLFQFATVFTYLYPVAHPPPDDT